MTLRQKSQIIELSGELTTEQLAKKFHVHPTTVTRTLRKKQKILDQASRVNVNFKTVQTNQKNEEHDSMILKFIKINQQANKPLTIKDICDKAVEYAHLLDREIKSKRGWWRRFKVRCNIVRSKLSKNSEKKNKDNLNLREKKNNKQKDDRRSSETTNKNYYTFKIKDSVTHSTTNEDSKEAVAKTSPQKKKKK